MQTNSNPDQPKHAQPTEMLAPQAQLEDLQKKRETKPPPPASETDQDVASAELPPDEGIALLAISKLKDFLQWFAVVLEVALAIRFVFRLIGADPTNLFAGFLYSLTDIVLFPFWNIVKPSFNNRLEWQTIIAMIIYWLIFTGIRRFLHILITVPEETTS
jgi:YGGT family